MIEDDSVLSEVFRSLKPESKLEAQEKLNSIFYQVPNVGWGLTDLNGNPVVEGPLWKEIPFIMGSIFFKHKGLIWDIAGNKYNWLSGDLVVFINNWMCQEINDKCYMVNVESCIGDPSKRLEYISVDEYGFAGFEYAIVRVNGVWQKYIYSLGYWKLTAFNIRSITNSELRVLEEKGASESLISDIYRAQGLPFRGYAQLQDDQLYQKMTGTYYQMISTALKCSSTEILSSKAGIPLHLAYRLNKLIGKRTYFAK